MQAQYELSQELMNFQKKIDGEILLPHNTNFKSSISSFTIFDTPNPDIVVIANTVEDVIKTVNFAREQGLAIGVHNTGHNIGKAFQGGIRINVSRLQGVWIDPDTRIARVRGGTRWQEVIDAAAEYGLAPLNGSSPQVGVVGYTLFGGLSWLVRKYGAAVHSVTAIEIVTADGRLRRVTARNNPELFWALRGGSGNFGIVTALEFQLYPVRTFYAGSLTFASSEARNVLHLFNELMPTFPNEFTAHLVIMNVPDMPMFPPHMAGKQIVMLQGAYVGSNEEGERILAPFRELDGLIADHFGEMPYYENAKIANDPTSPSPTIHRTAQLATFGPEEIETICTLMDEQPIMRLELRLLGGALNHEYDSAFGKRDALMNLFLLQPIFQPETLNANIEMLEQALQTLQPYLASSLFLGFLGSTDHGSERTRAGFSPENYERLQAIKQQYDPGNMFSLNHNIVS